MGERNDTNQEKISKQPDDKSTGAGSEATVHDKNSDQHDREHRSGYGGKGGEPDTSSDNRS